MPNCRNCGSRITKFDTDICPVCGCKNPLDGMTSSTIEITSQIDAVNPNFKSYHPKSRQIILILFCLLGFSGLGFFYQGFIKKGILWAIFNILFFVAGSLLTGFFGTLGMAWGFIIFLLVIYIVNILCGLFYLLKDNLKDAQGEFLK